MEFKEKLPIWENEGVEPPKSKQEEGWKVGDRPPADWFNWLQNRTYRSLEELRNISSDNLGQFEESIKELESKMPETLDDLYVSESWKVPGGQAVHALQNFKADKTDVGELSDLQTENKDNLVSAINELTNKSDLLVKGVDPTPENKNYKIGQMWFNKENGSLFILKGFDSNKLAIWSIFNSDGLIEDIDDDLTGSPGNGKLLKGTMEEGYFGAVSSSDLISGDELAIKVGVTEGTAQHSNTPWHKFAYKDKILFVAQKTIRNSISWDHLNSNNVIYGNKKIEIDGVKYEVRLIRGALTDPSKYNNSDKGAKGSEWNRLILPLHEERKDNSWSKRYVEDDLQDWKTYLSNSDMVVSSGDGRATWCQEVSGDDSALRVIRGFAGVSNSSTSSSSYTGSYLGWRPVLEVVQ